MAASAARALVPRFVDSVAFVRKIPWTASANELREHFAQFGHIKRCYVPFDEKTGFHTGIGWVYFSSYQGLQNALQQEKHVIDGVNVHVEVMKPKAQTSDEEKDF